MPSNTANPTHLIWIDLEMSGLDPDKERILEIALVVTDLDLNEIAHIGSMVIRQDSGLLDAMDEWNSKQHRKTGLYQEVLKSQTDEKQAELAVLEFLNTHSAPGQSPMCGSSVHQDRRFLRRYMPSLHEFFHYRNLDVSTVRALAKYWRPELPEQYIAPPTEHRALSDIRESVAELDYYRRHFLNTNST